jgi:hypothetical protein
MNQKFFGEHDRLYLVGMFLYNTGRFSKIGGEDVEKNICDNACFNLDVYFLCLQRKSAS